MREMLSVTVIGGRRRARRVGRARDRRPLLRCDARADGRARRAGGRARRPARGGAATATRSRSTSTAGTLDVDLRDDEIAQRLAAWTPPAAALRRRRVRSLPRRRRIGVGGRGAQRRPLRSHGVLASQHVGANRFTGRRALVTGAGSGIGEAVARRLHAEGAEVVLADISAAPVEAVAAELGERATALQLDVRDEDAVREAVRRRRRARQTSRASARRPRRPTRRWTSGRTSSRSTRAARSSAASTPSRAWSSAAAARS